MKHINSLINASSPYLLQHAHNPVNWYEWNAESLAKAKAENKLIIVSIGYSACHWCHVMERESFELEEVAEVMNKHFICIKVDREERPDIDQIYMLAVQLMNGQGGWPLNAICLPDQRPIYGGTYFRKTDWISILQNVAGLWANDPDKAKDYAKRLTDGINEAEKIIPNTNPIEFDKNQLEEIVKPWINHFDITDGGYNRAPKFPLPNNWTFLLRYSFLTPNQSTFHAVTHTLEQMSLGGIYDQVGGGFARYSVDGKWHVPHFEKMLYDNAQLIGLYAEAYQAVKYESFKQVAIESIEWVFREMQAENGLFFSALDADSEGIEGKFYVWDKEEFEQVVGEDASLLADYFNVTESGNWEEEETNILRRLQDDDEFLESREVGKSEVGSPKSDVGSLEVWKSGSQEVGKSESKGALTSPVSYLTSKIESAKQKLLAVRNKRVKPGLDDKCLTAWNAMMIKALADVSQIFDDANYYHKAKTAMLFILENMVSPDGGLYRNYKNGKATINGFLDDYAFAIEALIALYEADFDEEWLLEAKSLTNYVIANFTDNDNEMFFYTSAKGETLIARKHEVMDNVIPASNSVMAQNLQKLGLFFDEESYLAKASAMLKSVLPRIKAYGSAYSNWSIQLLHEVYGINEIALTGLSQSDVKKELLQKYIPNKILLGGTKSSLPLLSGKFSEETEIYVCRNKTCQLPVDSVKEAMAFINES